MTAILYPLSLSIYPNSVFFIFYLLDSNIPHPLPIHYLLPLTYILYIPISIAYLLPIIFCPQSSLSYPLSSIFYSIFSVSYPILYHLALILQTFSFISFFFLFLIFCNLYPTFSIQNTTSSIPMPLFLYRDSLYRNLLFPIFCLLYSLSSVSYP
jgi:hypothetical protein